MSLQLLHNIRDYNTYPYTIPSWELIESLSNDDSDCSKYITIKKAFAFFQSFCDYSKSFERSQVVNFPGNKFLGTKAKLRREKKNLSCSV